MINRFNQYNQEDTEKQPFDATKTGIAVNTIKGVLGWVPPKDNPYLKVAKDIAQGVARTVGTVGITAGNVPTQITNKITGKEQPLPFEEEIPTKGNKITEAVFGGKPIRTVQKQVQKTQETLKPYIGEKASKISALPLVGLGIAMDLSGFGGSKSVKAIGEIPETFFKVVAKDSDIISQFLRLKKIGLDDANAKALANRFSNAKNVDEVKAVLGEYMPSTPTTSGGIIRTPEISGTTKPMQNRFMLSGVNETIQPTKPTIDQAKNIETPEVKTDSFFKKEPSTETNLIEEAKKYKSAEEFWNNNKNTSFNLGGDKYELNSIDSNGNVWMEEMSTGRIGNMGNMDDTLNKLKNMDNLSINRNNISRAENELANRKLNEESIKIAEDISKQRKIEMDKIAEDFGAKTAIEKARVYKNLKKEIKIRLPSGEKLSGETKDVIDEMIDKLGYRFYQKGDEYVELLKLNDYGINIKKTFGSNDIVKYAKTKSQLTDIRNKANQATPIPTQVTAENNQTLTNLISEAKKYKSAEEFYNAKGLSDEYRNAGLRGNEQFTKFWEKATGKKAVDNYQMTHRPTESGALASDISKGGEFVPEDVYQHPEWYFGMNQNGEYGIATRESFNAVKKIKGKPNADITIYRASPSETLNNGDWVTLSKKYAEIHAGDKMPIHAFKVKAKDVQFAGDDINEFGYFGKSQLANIRNKAQTKTPIETPAYTQENAADSVQRQIIDARDAQKAADEFKYLETEPYEFPQETQEIREMAKAVDLPAKANNYKDISVTEKNLKDIYRNTEKVFGNDFKAVDDALLYPLEVSKGQLIDWYNQKIDLIKKGSGLQYGWKRGGKESAAIQEYGEGLIKYDDLVKKFGDEKAKQIAETVPFYRQMYDEIIEKELWPVQMKIYPNTPNNWTPKLENYFRHGTEAQSGLARLQTIFENPIKIDPMLVGKTETTKPLSKWQSFKQKRIFKEAKKPDAIGGLLDYVTNAGYSIKIDPHIGKFRAFHENLALNTLDTKRLNNYIESLVEFEHRLAGKSSPMDRAWNSWVGRRNLQAINWVNNRVKANTVMGNVSSSLSQLGNIPQGIASAGIPNSLKGMGKSLAQIFIKDQLMAKSNFIKERFFRGFDTFDPGMLNNAKKFGKWMITVLDEVGTKFIWNSQIEKAKQAGMPMEEAIRFADRETKKLVAGRGIGDLPLMQSSQLMQILAPFQVEVTNLWWVLGDIKRAKKYTFDKGTGEMNITDKSKLAKMKQYITLFVALYYLNNALEKATGNRLLLDPIQMMKDAAGEVSKSPDAQGFLKAGGRIAGEVLGNMPFGQTLASIYPEYGAKPFDLVKLPTRKELFGREDPTRFGASSLVMKGIQDPLYKIIPPFGGGQLKKTIEGLSTVEKGRSESSSGAFQYGIEQTPSKYLKSAIFGKSSLPEAQQYYDKKNKVISNPSNLNRFKEY